MARWALDTLRVRAEWWDEDEWVEIKKLSGWERDKMQAALVKVAANLGLVGRDMDALPAELNFGEANYWILKFGIKAWNLKGPDGKPVPLNDTWLKRLAPEDQDWLVKQINEFNRPPSESFPAESEGGGDGSGGGNIPA